MKDIIIDCFKTIKQNYIVFMLAVVAFATLNMCEFSAMLDYLTYPTISLVLYMTLMKKKKIRWKTLALYFVFCAGSILIFDYGLSFIFYIVSKIFIYLPIYYEHFGFLLDFNKKIPVLLLYTMALLPAIARVKLILPFILSENYNSINTLINISKIKYSELMIVVIILYIPFIEFYLPEGALGTVLFALKPPLICIFNLCFYKSRLYASKFNSA